MNKLIRRVAMTGVCVVGISGAIIGYTRLSASSGTPGTIDDPLVAKSYVDEQNDELLALVEELIDSSSGNGSNNDNDNESVDMDEIFEYIDVKLSDSDSNDNELVDMEEIYDYIDDKLDSIEITDNDTGNEEIVAANGFVVLELQEFDRLICEESTEIILRAGAAVAIGNASGDGLADVTIGADVKSSENITINHLLIAPRTDGRGLIAQSKSYVMVKGNYTIQ